MEAAGPLQDSCSPAAASLPALFRFLESCWGCAGPLLGYLISERFQRVSGAAVNVGSLVTVHPAEAKCFRNQGKMVSAALLGPPHSFLAILPTSLCAGLSHHSTLRRGMGMLSRSPGSSCIFIQDPQQLLFFLFVLLLLIHLAAAGSLWAPFLPGLALCLCLSKYRFAQGKINV